MVGVTVIQGHLRAVIYEFRGREAKQEFCFGP